MRCDVLKRSVALWVKDAMGAVAVAAFIASQREQHGIPQACQLPGAGGVPVLVLQVEGRGPLPPRAARRERLKAEIARLFAAREGKDGSPRITAALREAGWRVSENTVAAPDARAGPGRPARRRGARATTRPGKGRWRAPDLVKRDFAARRRSTASGTATAPRSPPARASCTWTACWTWARAGSSGSRSASTTTRRWPTARWPWRWRCAAAPCPA